MLKKIIDQATKEARNGLKNPQSFIPHSIKMSITPADSLYFYKTNAYIDSCSLADGWPGYFGSPRLSSPELGQKVWKARSFWIITQVGKEMDGAYDFSQPTMFQLMERSASTRGINQDALMFDQQKEAKQNEWLKRKGLQ